MAEKAYLMIRLNVHTIPPLVVGAEISHGPLTQRTFAGLPGERWVEMFHVRGNTFAQAEEKLLRMVQGQEPCPFGDVRALWMFLDPSEEAHRKRYELNKFIKEMVTTLSQKASAASAQKDVPADHLWR